MNRIKNLLQMLLAFMLVACGQSSELSWTEDVKLPDGRAITLSRWVEFKGPHAMGDTATESKQRLEFKHPETGEIVKWENVKEQGTVKTVAVWLDKGRPMLLSTPAQVAATYGPSVNSVVSSLGSGAPQSIIDYKADIGSQFATRESNVTSYFAPGSVVYSISTAGNTITGAGQGNAVQFGTANMGSVDGRADMHSQALLTAGLLSTPFKNATVAVQRVLPRVMDKTFYALPTSGSERNLLIDLIRSEETSPGNGKLSHFAIDLNKLGTNIAGLNIAAQDALIAQGIEWYYWQGTDYAGQEFFTATGALMQYTSNYGNLGSLNRDANKALFYVSAWLDPIVRGEGGFNIGYKFEQWNVVAGTAGATATALNAAKTQIFVGNTGGDTFTGGAQDDILIGGAGADKLTGGVGMDHLFGGADVDILDGGPGGDYLYGGAGSDRYELKAGELWDTISDSDGLGKIFVSTVPLTGGKKDGDNHWVSDDQVWGYLLTGSGDLVISKYGSVDRIVVQGWSSAKNVGITLDNAPAAVVVAPGVYGSPGHITDDYLGSGDALGRLTFEGLDGLDYSNWDLTGLTGNDLMFGFKFADKLDGSEGNDVIFGGLGEDDIQGGANNDVIMSNINAGKGFAPTGWWNLTLYPLAPVWTTGQGSRYFDSGHINPADPWMVKRDVDGVLLMLDISANLVDVNPTTLAVTSRVPEDPNQGDSVDAGDGDDYVWGGLGPDIIFGGLGVDQLQGLGGGDVIEGGDGDDKK